MKFYAAIMFASIAWVNVAEATTASMEIKPMNFVSPSYEESKEYKLALEFHVTQKIAIYTSYQRSRYQVGLLDAQDYYDSYRELPAIQEYDIAETSLGIHLYANQTPSSLFLGMGLTRRKGSYQTLVNQVPIEWHSTSEMPEAVLGYRLNLAQYFMLRAGVAARYVRNSKQETAKLSQSFYLRDDSREYLFDRVDDIEGQDMIKVSLDLGVGIIF